MTQLNTRFMKRLIPLLCCTSLFFAALPAMAQEWPTGPIRLIVPFAPGGATDVLGRLVAQQLSIKLGKTATVETHDGAGGAIGTATALRSPPAGNTLLLGTTATLVTGPILRKNAGSTRHEPAYDAVPITRFFASASAVIVNPALPVHSIAELIEYARRNPDKLFYGSAGTGSNSNLIAEYFKAVAKVKIEHVPFRGTAPAFNELLANRVQVMFESQPSSLPNILAGRVRALGVTTKKRAASLPNVAAVAETKGMESFEAISWAGIFVPAGTARTITAKLYKALTEIANVPEVQERMKSLGADYETTSTEDFIAFVQAERDKWSEVIRVGGIKGE